MELTNEEKLSNLPKRPKRTKINNKWNVSDYACNFYEIKFKQNFKNIYQYSFECDPPLPEESRKLLIEVIKNAEKELIEKIEIFSYKGNMVWGLKPLKTSTLSVQSFVLLKKNEKEKIRQNHSVFLKIARVFNLEEDSFITDFGQKILQVLNIKFKESLRNKNYIEITRNKYYTKHELTETKDNLFNDLKLRILRGFSFTFVPMKLHNLRARLDVSTKYIHEINLLEFLNECGSKDAQRQIIGRYVIAFYGNFKVYRIEDIDYEQNPLSIFSLHNEQRKMTFKDYFFEKYSKNVKDLKQPMLKVVTKVVKVINKEGKKEEIPSYGFMVPELVKLAGVTEYQVKHKQFRAALEFARKGPSEVNVECESIKKEFTEINKDSVFQVGDQIHVTGYELPRVLYETTSIYKSQREDINLMQGILNPIQLEEGSWIMIYSESNEKIAKHMLDSMNFAQKKLGILLKNPIQKSINQRGEKAFCDCIRVHLKKEKFSFAFVILNQHEERYYSQLKRLFVNEFNIPSQLMKSSTIFSKVKAHKSILSISTKILLQINAKLGLPIWKILPQNEYWKKRSLIYGAFSLKKSQKSKNEFTLSFVGTSNEEMTEFYSDCNFNVRKNESGIDKKYYVPIFTQWMQSYISHEGGLPHEIIFFREGSNEYQTLHEMKNEIEALKEVVKSLSKSQKSEPSIVYIYVNKKTDTKFYSTTKIDRKGNLEYKNPLPGTVILEDLSEKDDYDFYLAAQKVTQGTCVPTFYKVLYNNSAMPEDALVEMTHEQCYNYSNWNGPVRVPSCLQYASKLSSLVTEHIKQPLECSEQFKRNLYYL